MPVLLSLVVGFLVMLPFMGLCLWASYRLGRRLRITDQTAALVLGLGVFPLPFLIACMVVLFFVLPMLHLPHAGFYAFTGNGIAGWIGMGAARIVNLKQQAAKSSDVRHP